VDDFTKLENTSYLFGRKIRISLAASRILNLLALQNPRSLGIQSVVIESDYVDRDSNVAYAQLYSRAFKDYPRRTIRLHFFKKQVTSCEELLNEQILQESYVGYCVMSPIHPRTIGRTVLPPPKGDTAWFFVPTQSEFSVNLAGAKLTTEGTAFIQQDGRIAACASAATWMSTIITRRRFGFEVLPHSMSEITKMATKYTFPTIWGGTTPGLRVEQIIWALHEMGYEPLSHVVKDSDVAHELIYNYIESGIPPILIIRLSKGLHAVTAVGHTYDLDGRRKEEIIKGVNSTKIWCPYILIHDDQIGPYLKLRIDPQSVGTNKGPSLFLDETDPFLGDRKKEIKEWYRDAFLLFIIAPLPPRYGMRPEDAAKKGKVILTKAYEIYRSFLTDLGEKMPELPIFRCYFTPSNDFKRRFQPGKVPGLSCELAHWYRGSLYPRYIWVIELCSLKHRNVKDLKKLRIIADVTIDPTSSPYSLDFITLHLPHLFFRMLPKDTNVINALQTPIAFIKDDQPYQPLVRLEMGQAPVIVSP